MPKTIIEPFKIKMTEPLPILSSEQRRRAIEAAHFNLFFLPSDQVMFDLLTDSGTGSMSHHQWSALMAADESYAGSKSFERFRQSVSDVTGFPEVIPTHQGRAAEYLLCKVLLKPGQKVLSNSHFDTTRANVEVAGGLAVDLPLPVVKEDSQSYHPFKGNMDLATLESQLAQSADNVAFVVLTVTNNSVGGQPVSLENIQATSRLCKKYQKLLFIDCARFAENAWFIKQREGAYQGLTPKQIAREMFSYADGCWMSAKKDAFGNIGGFLALRDQGLADEIRTHMVVTEGFPTYGGLAGRDLEALAVGLQEVLDEDYLRYRIRSTAYFGEGLKAAGYHLVEPFGGHAVYIDAAKTLPHLSWRQFPGQSLSVALYEFAGIRSVEIGSVMLGRKNPQTGEEEPALKELVRLAIPRRVYTQSHVDYMIESAQELLPLLPSLPGYAFTYQAPVLRHFTARFRRLHG
ncbi:MAG: tryptophanase [Bdellovibrionaceae bacterium]|nr:tryptophanase [Pseudobdellovibrionaceae bacterium]